MNKINPKKLLHSKWTAVTPKTKEKHFMVTELEFDEEGQVLLCVLEAVMTRRAEAIEWTTLRNADIWKHGWV